MKPSILLAYFDQYQEAKEASGILSRLGYRRLAWVSKNADGKILTGTPFLQRKIFEVIGALLLLGTLVAILSRQAHPLTQMFHQPSPPLIWAIAIGILGVFLGLLVVRRTKFGIDRESFEEQVRWLITGETVLILQAPIERLKIPVSELLQNSEMTPTVFVLHARCKSRVHQPEDWTPSGPSLNSAQLQDHARSLAETHRLDSKPVRNGKLLRRLEQGRHLVQQTCLDLSEASELRQNMPPTFEWLLDNEYVLEGNARDVHLNLPLSFYRKLPALASETDHGLPRVYGLARELTEKAELRLNEENILMFIEAYQSTKPLSIGELWTIPQMLCIVLIETIGQLADRASTELREEELADFWTNRLIAANRCDPKSLYSILAKLTEAYPNPSPYFASQMISRLYDEGTVLVQVQFWLERLLEKSIHDLLQYEKNRQAADRRSIESAFASLRFLGLIDWKECFERLSVVEQTLRRDPSGIYPQMDFETRNLYRRAIENIQRRSDLNESQIAQYALDLATELDPITGCSTHIGAYLIGDKRKQLTQRLQYRETLYFRALDWSYRHHSAVYFSGLFLFMAMFILLILHTGFHTHSLWIKGIIAALLLIPVSQLSIEVLNTLIMRLFPPRTLPKMNFKDSGIPDDCRTLVVIPMMLANQRTIEDEVEKLEIRFLANQEANLLFSLGSDYLDATSAHCVEDEPLLHAAMQQIQALNHKYGEGRFFLFHRDRTWCESEGKFIGWERKRGKLEELNNLIVGTRPPEAGRMVYVGDPEKLSDVRFVITLDSDTQLPAGAARRMIETLAHPLNKAHLGDKGRVQSGYTIIQPAVSPSLPSATGSAFSRLFSNPVGIDPYTNAVSDVYQDLAGEGSYHGKGIYDVRTFSRVLSGRFPEGLLLSHDLIEGAHVRVGLASDIKLYDECPQDYLSYIKRQHRWIRGDWQIADWAMPHILLPNGKRGPNPLSWFDRWKIFDNLRRSLLPVASLALLITAWLVSSRTGWIASGVVAIQLLFHSLVQPFTWVTTHQGLKGVSITRVAHDLLRVIAEAAFLPYQSWLTLDAIARVWYRRYISHRGLLEWTSAQATHDGAQTKVPMFLLSMGLVSLFSLSIGSIVVYRLPANLGVASPWLVLWFLSPLVAWLLSRKSSVKPRQYSLPVEDREFLRNVARRTWRYFSEFVNEETSWLPPDNYQVSYQNKLALRTSPTNIGLYLVSVLSAHDFGYITIDEVIETLAKTMKTIGKLNRYEGHLLNWYDIQTLEPLNPHYVSTVDSGNFLGTLWTLDRGLESLMQIPLLGAQAFVGLHDTADVLRQTIRDDGNTGLDNRTLENLFSAWGSPQCSVPAWLELLRRTEKDTGSFVEHILDDSVEQGDFRYWAKQLQHQASAWLDIADRYLAWIDILAEKTEDDVAELGADTLEIFRESLHHVPSLQELAKGDQACIASLQTIRRNTHADNVVLLDWIDRVVAAYDRAKWLAGEELALMEQLSQTCVDLSESINMRFLYNTERRLFSIGFNVSESRLDQSFYDLLASEARLGSFVAIARGDVPCEHWFALGRPFGAVGRHRALLSWTGTMFEYMMPLLFQKSYNNALLDKAAREAVAIQIAYGRKHRIPWGISECAFGDLDVQKTYQYQAFGVPELGLKRGLAKEIVVAPYATFLAVDIAPQEAMKNLKRLADLGLLSRYGYYESIDYSSRSNPLGVNVRSYMVHHQGMIFLALNNFLHDGCLQRHFHTDPRVRTVEPLLHERIPQFPPLHHITTRERVASVPSIGEISPSTSHFKTPYTTTPKTQLLSNGHYDLMVTGSGGGYSRWNEFDITRWRSDSTRDSWGSFCYIHDADSGSLWCNTYQPTCGDVEQFSVNFALDRAVFRRVDDGIESETEIIVAPEDDVEIRRMTLINRSSIIRRIELTSYIELALAPHNADRQHAAFNKLYIQTEALPEHRALLASRRLRSDDESPIFVAHRIVFDPNTIESVDNEFRFETDRTRFIGRGSTLSSPMGTLRNLGGSQGFVLDPILSLSLGFDLPPGQRITVSLILAVAPSREQVIDLIQKYGEAHAIERAMEFAWTSAQLELRFLRIQPDEARRFQQLASHLLYPNLRLRSAASSITNNRKGPSGLWSYSISGDLPITMIAIGEIRDIGLIRQILQAHVYWGLHGLVADLVILNEEAAGYTQPLHEELEHLIQFHASNANVERPGGVYLLRTNMIPEEDLKLLRAAASVMLVAARGGLPQQLALPPRDVPTFPESVIRKQDPRDPSVALPFMTLPFFNSLGGFAQGGREYAIYLGPGINTPAPWTNVIANPTFGTLISETGAGFTWQGNSQRNRLTQWSNDPVTDPSCEAIYIRDEDTGIYWTPTASPIREEMAYRARHGAGYSVFEHNSHGIEQELTVFIPVDDQGGKPIKLQRLSLRNGSNRPRKLSLTYYVEWTLGEDRESSQMHVVTAWDEETQSLLARNCYNEYYADWVAFAAASAPVASYTCDRASFLGRNRTLSNPAAMDRVKLSRRTGAGLDPCAALQIPLKLAVGERMEITFMLGQASSLEQIRSMVKAYKGNGATDTTLRQTQAWWDGKRSAIQVQTPELATDIMINHWLLYQSLSCRIWGRSGFYQSGGAFGFRDQLQDVLAMLYSYPSLAREHILLAASHQFKEGDVQHWWHPPNGEGIRSRVSDDLLWLPFVVSQYVKVTADVGILHEMVPFLDAPMLASDQSESFQSPVVSSESATLFEHCQRALAHSQRFGAHGLPLMGSGDWNDGMNSVGAGGKGESIWLAWFMVDILRGMAELADSLGRPALSQSYLQERETLTKLVEQFAWDGEWYLRATYDDGTLLGSSLNQEARIDSLAQSWASLSGTADEDRVKKALNSAWNLLVREDEKIVQLFDPPFDQSKPSPGYIMGYPPGVRENGGQYTHAAIWLAISLARRGDGSRATSILRMINPIEHTREPEAVWRYGIEPYVVAADVYRLPGRVGLGGWSWYTGSSAWMYRAWVEEILGLKVCGATMQVVPVIPGWWDGFQMSYRYGEALYDITVENPDHCEQGVAWIEMDGQRLDDKTIQLVQDLMKHRILVRMGNVVDAL